MEKSQQQKLKMTQNQQITTSKNKNKNDSKSFWIHCNRCFEVYARKRKRIFLLACLHISCEICSPALPAGTPGGTVTFQCPICNKLVRGRHINNNLPSHIKEFFHPEPWLSDLPNGRIIAFQQKQRKHFFDNFKRTKRVLQQLIESKNVLRSYAQTKFKELELARHERMRLEKRVRLIVYRRRQLQQEAIKKRLLAEKTAPEATTTATTKQQPKKIVYSQPNRVPVNSISSNDNSFLPPQSHSENRNSKCAWSYLYKNPYADLLEGGPTLPIGRSRHEIHSFIHKEDNFNLD